MARKKITTTEEEVEENPTPDENNNPPEETKVEEPKAPEFDKEALKAEVAAELLPQATEAAKQSLIDSLSDKKELSEYEQFVEKYQKEQGKNPSYVEALQFVKGQAKDEILAELNKEVADEETKKKADEDALKDIQGKQQAFYQEQWDQQLADLEAAGKIPPMVNPADPEDPGYKARSALYTSLDAKIKDVAKINEERKAKGEKELLPSYSIKEIYYENYTSPSAQPAGANAPVAGVRRTATSSGSSGFSYADIRGKKPSDILNESLK